MMVGPFTCLQLYLLSNMVFVVVVAAVLTQRKMTLHTAEWNRAVSSFYFDLIYTTAGNMPTGQRPREREEEEDRGMGGRE